MRTLNEQSVFSLGHSQRDSFAIMNAKLFHLPSEMVKEGFGMTPKSLLSDQILSDYKEYFLPKQLSPTDFLVWHSLKITCYMISNNTKVAHMVTVASVSHLSGISRETVRRAMHKLAGKGFAIKINELWIYKAPF
jgi:hypothetical protein